MITYPRSRDLRAPWNPGPYARAYCAYTVVRYWIYKEEQVDGRVRMTTVYCWHGVSVYL